MYSKIKDKEVNHKTMRASMEDEDELLYLGNDPEEFKDCEVGICMRFGMQEVVAYDYDKVIEHFMTKDGMTEGEAVEWFDFNVIGAWMGERTPVFIQSNRGGESGE